MNERRIAQSISLRVDSFKGPQAVLLARELVRGAEGQREIVCFDKKRRKTRVIGPAVISEARSLTETPFLPDALDPTTMGAATETIHDIAREISRARTIRVRDFVLDTRSDIPAPVMRRNINN